MSGAEFDNFAAVYAAQHAESLGIFGEDIDYFSRYKVNATAKYLESNGIFPKEILDFGCGIGNSVPDMINNFPYSNLTCLDTSKNSLDICEKISSSISTVIYDGEKIPFPDKSFDLIFTSCVFHHIHNENHIDTLKEIRRVLSNNGVFILFEHNPWNPLTQIVVRACPFDKDAQLISAPLLRRKFKAAGFAAERTDYRVFFPPRFKILHKFESLLYWLPVGAQYSLIATK